MSKHTRHDRFFRQMLRFPSFQQGFIRFRVPSKVTAPVNLKKLELAPESFVRANKTIVPDCVLRAPFKEGSGWAYFPIEQQTNPNDDMAARAMITKGRILEFEMNIQKNKTPPLIWHIVFSKSLFMIVANEAPARQKLGRKAEFTWVNEHFRSDF